MYIYTQPAVYLYTGISFLNSFLIIINRFTHIHESHLFKAEYSQFQEF